MVWTRTPRWHRHRFRQWADAPTAWVVVVVVVVVVVMAKTMRVGYVQYKEKNKR